MGYIVKYVCSYYLSYKSIVLTYIFSHVFLFERSIVRINALTLQQEESGNTKVSLHFSILPDHLRRFKNVQRDMMTLDRIFSQEGESQIDLSIGIASAEKEELAWSPKLRHRFVEEMFPPLNYELNVETNITSGESLERSSNGCMLKFELGVNKDELESIDNEGHYCFAQSDSKWSSMSTSGVTFLTFISQGSTFVRLKAR